MEKIAEKKKYLIVRNITDSPSVFEKERLPGQKPEDTIAVSLKPAEATALLLNEWEDDGAIRRMVRAGALHVVGESNDRVNPQPELPFKRRLTTFEKGVVHDIVFGDDRMSESAIMVNPGLPGSHSLDPQNRGVDVQKLKTRSRDILDSALLWIDTLNEWDPKWYIHMRNRDRRGDEVQGIDVPKRRAMIVERIKEIDRIPMR